MGRSYFLGRIGSQKIIEGKNQAGGNGHHIEVKTYERHS